MSSSLDNEVQPDEHASSRQHWKWSFVAAMASYIDAGSIVAGSVALSIWSSTWGMSSSAVGLLGAISSNAISAGVGALIGGYVCDKYGRKKIYAYDLLLYMFGTLFLIFATGPWMIYVGFVIVGLAVGADIPASWSLITEFSPARKRGKFGGLSQILWSLGPIITLALGLALHPLGLLGARLLFVQLFVVALITWILRHGVGESARWTKEVEQAKTGPAQPSQWSATIRLLFSKRGSKTLLFLVGTYGLWNLFAGTNGFYTPFLFQAGGISANASVGVQCMYFGLVALFTMLVFMPYNDRFSRRTMFAISSVIQLGGILLSAFLPLNLPMALGYMVLIGIGGGFGAQHFFQLWSGELFPTKVRSTAQGLMFAIVRIGLGFWSFFVPIIARGGFHTVAFSLAGFVLLSGLIGTIWAPKTEGKTLEEIQIDQGWTTADIATPVTVSS
jgi:inositol transporter-like SP family MFS transporter